MNRRAVDLAPAKVAWWHPLAPVVLFVAIAVLIYQTLMQSPVQWWSLQTGASSLWVVVDDTGDRRIIDPLRESMDDVASGASTHIVSIGVENQHTGWPFKTSDTTTVRLEIDPLPGVTPMALDGDLRSRVVSRWQRYMDEATRADLRVGDHVITKSNPAALYSNIAWYLAAALGLYGSARWGMTGCVNFVRARRCRRLSKNRCPICSYDLSGGEPNNCPECGCTWEPPQAGIESDE